MESPAAMTRDGNNSVVDVGDSLNVVGKIMGQQTIQESLFIYFILFIYLLNVHMTS